MHEKHNVTVHTTHTHTNTLSVWDSFAGFELIRIFRKLAIPLIVYIRAIHSRSTPAAQRVQPGGRRIYTYISRTPETSSVYVPLQKHKLYMGKLSKTTHRFGVRVVVMVCQQYASRDCLRWVCFVGIRARAS